MDTLDNFSTKRLPTNGNPPHLCEVFEFSTKLIKNRVFNAMNKNSAKEIRSELYKVEYFYQPKKANIAPK